MDKLKLSGVFENGYGLIPKKVMKDSRLHIYSKAIYAYLCSYSGSGESAFPSQKLIMNDLGISKDSLNKYLKQLKDYDYIKVVQEKENGKFARNVYTINVSPYTVSSDTVRTESVSIGYGQTDTNNNSNLNNNNINNNNNNKVVVDDFVETEDMKKRRIEITKFKEEMSFKLREKNLNVKVEDLLKYAGGDIELIKRQFEHFADKGVPLLVASIKNKYEIPKQIEKKEEKIIKIYENKEINNVSIEI